MKLLISPLPNNCVPVNPKILLTGIPGVGKTTLIMHVVDSVKAAGYSVGGMITKALNENQVRVGFEILDLYSGTKGLLAHTDMRSQYKIGKFGVNIQDLENIGVTSIKNSLKRLKTDLLVIDEIGPMELISQKFKDAIKEVIESEHCFLGSVQFKLHKQLHTILNLGKMPKIFKLTYENRIEKTREVLQELLNDLEHQERIDYFESNSNIRKEGSIR